MDKDKNPKTKSLLIITLLFLILAASQIALAGGVPPRWVLGFKNTDDLPALLELSSGEQVATAEAWNGKRRPEILELYREHVYGRAPSKPEAMSYEIFEESGEAFYGDAVRKQVRINFTGGPDGPKMDLLMYLPRSEKKVPVFLLLNFKGNHTVNPDPAIRITKSWVPSDKLSGGDNEADEEGRGGRYERFPIENIMERGYGIATAYYGDIDPDFNDGFENGVHGAFDPEGKRPPDAWGSISAWAWGLSRAMDYLETEPMVDSKKVAVLGHSRLGKTALWAGAEDTRFAIVISNESGCGGAAIFRRKKGETITAINIAYPHWFAKNFRDYSYRAEALPVDQHMLIALIAPRPVYVASAKKDWWSDPKGEFLAAREAGPVYSLFGKGPLPVDDMPDVNSPVMADIGYHVRDGGHDLTAYDWARFMDFADMHFK